jgi:hypothetical protein
MPPATPRCVCIRKLRTTRSAGRAAKQTVGTPPASNGTTGSNPAAVFLSGQPLEPLASFREKNESLSMVEPKPRGLTRKNPRSGARGEAVGVSKKGEAHYPAQDSVAA